MEDIDKKIENQIVMICKYTNIVTEFKDIAIDTSYKVQKYDEKIVHLEQLIISLQQRINILNEDNQKLIREVNKLKSETREKTERKVNKAIRSYSVKNNPKSPIHFIPTKLPISELFKNGE